MDILLKLREYIENNKDKLTKEDIINIIEKYDLSSIQKNELLDIINDKKINNYKDDIVNNYLEEISKYPTLSFEELKKLYIELENGNKSVREKIINCNLKFVVLIAKKYRNNDVPLMDLISEGNIGLIKAVDKYDYHLGYKFTTYATWWIKNYIIKSIENKTVKIERRIQYRAIKVLKYEEELSKKLGRYPTDKELSDYYNEYNDDYNMKEMDIKYLKDLSQSPTSLNSKIASDEPSNAELIDFMSSNEEDITDEANRNILFEQIRNILNGTIKSNLTEQEKNVLLLRFGFNGPPHTLDEIAAIRGVTRERIRQIEGKALRKIKSYKTTKNIIKGYL